MELNPLLTLPGIQTDLYPTFLFSGIPTNLLCLYVIHVDLIEPSLDFSSIYNGQPVVFSCMF